MDTVRRWMTSPAVVAPETMFLPEARQLMHDHHIRRLPVVDARSQLVGIVSQGDINRVSDSHVTDVREYDLHHMVSNLPLSKIMTRDVVAVEPATSIVDVAQILLSRKFGGVPVVSAGEVIGIITESDLFRVIIMLQEEEQSSNDGTGAAILEQLPRGFREKVRL